ncbi:zinc ribbon domain-containing protein [Mycolicibacterium elephantis]
MSDQDRVPTAECRVCRTDVPAGRYCGLCGCHLTPRRAEGPDWLRVRDFGAAKDEHLLQPALTSSLFPHLPQRSRSAFRLGLAALLATLVAFTLLRLPAALVTVAALGLPVLFVLYLRESDAFRDFGVRTLAVTTVLGAGLGLGWVLLTEATISRSYELGLAGGPDWDRILRDGLAVPLGGVLLMLLPAVIVRLARPPSREALDGFIVGALGALTFTAASTLAHLAPQFGTGVVSGQPMESLLVEAGIRGVAEPVTAAAAGGLIGAALWFRRPASKQNQRPVLVRAVLVGFAVAVLTVCLALGVIDAAAPTQLLMLGLHLLLAAVALLLLRIGIHLALLHEAHDEIQADEPLLCAHCGHVVPDMAFCPACGVATRASSRSSRRSRRAARPVRATGPDAP